MLRAGVFFLALTSACGSYQTRGVALKSYPGPTDLSGVICVVRTGDEQVRESVPVWDNGVLVGATPSASHFCYRAALGPHTVRSELLVTSEVSLNVEAESRYWIEQNVERSAARRSWGRGLGVGMRPLEGVTLRLMSREEGARAIARTSHVELVDVPNGEERPRGGLVPSSRRD